MHSFEKGSEREIQKFLRMFKATFSYPIVSPPDAGKKNMSNIFKNNAVNEIRVI